MYLLYNMDNILFYSNKCKYCSKLIMLINEIDNINNYKLICIDNNKNFPYIQRVPTILINKLKKPLVGINAFNWIKTKSQFNKQSNNINYNPNKFLNSKDNPLLYQKNKNLNGKNTNINRYTFLNNDNSDKIFTYLNKEQSDINTLPEGDKINKTVQKRKLNKLLNLRSIQDTLIFDENNTDMSSHNQIISTQKDYLNKNVKNSDINNNMKKINFSMLKNNPSKIIPTTYNFGVETARTVIDKNKYNKME